MANSTYVTKMFDRLDRVCHEVYGTANRGVVEWLLTVNPGLEDHGIVLPLGLTIQTPPLPTPVNSEPIITQIHLWS